MLVLIAVGVLIGAIFPNPAPPPHGHPPQIKAKHK